jgi:hypothetical protein
MPLTSKYLMIASMDVELRQEAIFNDVYDNEHVPNLSKVPGVVSIARFEREELTMSIGGEKRMIKIENEPKYAAIYELESPEALVSKEWADAVERGRWPSQVRPYTKNRRHILLKVISPRG